MAEGDSPETPPSDNVDESKVAPLKKRTRVAGRKPELTIEGVSKAIADNDGNIAAIARKFGVSRTAIQQLISNNSDLQVVLSDARERVLDDTESSLFKAARAGDPWAVCFFLKTIGKNRGYTEKEMTPLDVLLATLPPHLAQQLRETLASNLPGGKDSPGASGTSS